MRMVLYNALVSANPCELCPFDASFLVIYCGEILKPAYSVGIISRYMEKPTKKHLDSVKRTIPYGLVYTKDQQCVDWLL